MKVADMHVAPIAIGDPPLLNAAGLHAPYALRVIGHDPFQLNGLKQALVDRFGDGGVSELMAVRRPWETARLHQTYLDCGLTDRDDAIEMRKKEPDWVFTPVRH